MCPASIMLLPPPLASVSSTLTASASMSTTSRQSRHTRRPRRILFETSVLDATTVLTSVPATTVLPTSTFATSLVPAAPTQAPTPECNCPDSEGLTNTGIVSVVFGTVIGLAMAYFAFKRYFDIKITRKPSTKSKPQDIPLDNLPKTNSTAQQTSTKDKDPQPDEPSKTKEYAYKGLDLLASNRVTIEDKVLASTAPNPASNAEGAAGAAQTTNSHDFSEDPMGYVGEHLMQNGVKYTGLVAGKAIEYRETIKEKGAWLINKLRGKKKTKETSDAKEADKPTDKTGARTHETTSTTADPQIPPKAMDSRLLVYWRPKPE